jgi:hypothetical protein
MEVTTMAKISARGAVKLAEATQDIPADDMGSVGGTIRVFYVLRSDGVVLRATSFPFHPGGSYDRKRSSYAVTGRMLKSTATRAELLAAFAQFAARKNAVLS